MRFLPLLITTVALLGTSAAGPSAGNDASDAVSLIAYAERDGSPDDWEIFVVTLDGRQRRNLTRDPTCDDVSPAWSPDGSTIAYICRPIGPSKPGLNLMLRDGSGRHRLVSGDAWSPSWSPDGQRLVFARGGRLYVVRADGRNLRSLTSGTPESDTPDWSPDGRSIAFARKRGRTTDTWVVKPDGTGSRLLARDGTNPQWSPDGRRIAFEIGGRTDGAAGGFYVMNVDGSGKRLVHDDGTNPSWSPDSKQIAFQRIGAPIRTEGVWVMNANGTGKRLLVRAVQPGGVAWDPGR